MDSTQRGGPRQQRWGPYNNGNGGTVMGVAGEDFCVMASDSRMSEYYSILSRDAPKLKQLSGSAVLGTAGMQAEAKTLWKVLYYKCTFYKHNHKKEISTPGLAQMLSNTLYYKRFFPYYAMNVLGGVDENGKGHVYGYDSIGSFEDTGYAVKGSGDVMMTSLLDNQVGFRTQKKNKVDLTLEETIDLVKDAFNGCAERDIKTGDFVYLAIITKDGIRWEKSELRRD